MPRLSLIHIWELRRGDRVEERFESRTISSSVCSRQTLRIVRECLQAVCTEGTASAFFRDTTRVRVAAKTGTAQITDARSREGRYYLGSMVAFFPADAPRYTVLTTIETRAQAGKDVYKRQAQAYAHTRNRREWFFISIRVRVVSENKIRFATPLRMTRIVQIVAKSIHGAFAGTFGSAGPCMCGLLIMRDILRSNRTEMVRVCDSELRKTTAGLPDPECGADVSDMPFAGEPRSAGISRFSFS